MPSGLDRRGFRGWWIVALIGAVAVVWIVWSQWDRIAGPGEVAADADGPSADVPDGAPDPLDGERARWEQALGTPPRWPEDLSNPADCAGVEADFAAVCRVLDGRESADGSATDGGSCALVREVAEHLAAEPPVVASELRDPLVVIRNAFHLYRTLGPERLDRIRTLLYEEHELAEPAAMALYRWAMSRERCAGPAETALDIGALYDWAAFPFHTLGGQAYLHRRAPRLEGLIGFYALLAHDEARRRGHDPQGVDPRREVERVRALLENEPLVFRDEYLATLDAMAESWKDRGTPS